MRQISEAHFAVLRRHMVEVVAIHAELAADELGKPALEPLVMAAMRQVPRHRFVPAALAPAAYQDTPLPIGFDKTISQPFIVAATAGASSHEAPTCSNGRSVPRPSVRLVPSKYTVPG